MHLSIFLTNLQKHIEKCFKKYSEYRVREDRVDSSSGKNHGNLCSSEYNNNILSKTKLFILIESLSHLI